MSLHVVNPELEARLAAQRRNSTVASVVIGILLLALLAMVFYFIGVSMFGRKTEAMVVYAEEAMVEDEVEKVKINNAVQKNPSPPSSSSAQVITVNAQSNFAVPTPDIVVDSLSVDFGDSDGFGDGWGGGGNGFGSGGAGTFNFMGSKMSGDKVCFVIDYSASMNGKRISLLKNELAKTISEFPEGADYQLIFFAGPAWVAGSTISNPRSLSTSTITYEGKSYNWRGHKYTNWAPVGKRQEVEWMKMNEGNREKSLSAIQNTGLVLGTTWLTPLEMALDMKPKPELVVFLTDGLSGKDSTDIARRMGDRAKQRGIKVNTIALMEPRARADMSELAKRSGGEFSLIGPDGKKEKQ